MKIVFFGTSKFAVSSLERLISSEHEVVAVVTQPDRPKGRSLKTMAPAVKECAKSNNIENILQPVILENEFYENLKSFDADLFVVIAYGHILKQNILDLPKHYCINIHASLLPKYRGAAPINWAIINSEKTTGVTAIKMNEQMDEGDIIGLSEIEISSNIDSLSLGIKLSAMGSDLLMDVINKIENNEDNLEKQDSSKAIHARKLKKEDGLIDWNKPALKIHDLIRGIVPWPGGYTFIDGKKLKICKTEVIDYQDQSPGKIIRPDKKTVLVGTEKGIIKLLEVQPESSKKMDISSFLRGHDLGEGEIFSNC